MIIAVVRLVSLYRGYVITIQRVDNFTDIFYFVLKCVIKSFHLAALKNMFALCCKQRMLYSYLEIGCLENCNFLINFEVAHSVFVFLKDKK